MRSLFVEKMLLDFSMVVLAITALKCGSRDHRAGLKRDRDCPCSPHHSYGL